MDAPRPWSCRPISTRPTAWGWVSSADVVATKGNFGELAVRIAGHMEREERRAVYAGMPPLRRSAACNFAPGPGSPDWWPKTVVVLTASSSSPLTASNGSAPAAGSSSLLGGLDHNQDLTRTYEQLPELHSMAPISIEGDHVVITAPLGYRASISCGSAASHHRSARRCGSPRSCAVALPARRSTSAALPPRVRAPGTRARAASCSAALRRLWRPAAR